MPVCPECGVELSAEATSCSLCGADVTPVEEPTAAGPGITNADYDPEAERERFERRYGIDIGDRTVDEFLSHLGQQDYSPTPWFWLVVVTELAGVGLFAAVVFADVGLGVDARIPFVVISLLLGLSIFVDTRVVGLFRRWAKIRWTYVLVGAIPLVGHLGGFFYLVLRRLKHEETAEHRRRLLDAGFDVGANVSDD